MSIDLSVTSKTVTHDLVQIFEFSFLSLGQTKAFYFKIEKIKNKNIFSQFQNYHFI